MKQTLTNRREFLKQSARTLAAALLAEKVMAAPHLSNPALTKKLIVLGIDGMDPRLLAQFVLRGEMPSFKKMMDAGYWTPLRTTTPPQSPVAWSSFISGTNPGGNGIFDFIHRDPATFAPFLSTSKSYDAAKVIKIGDWRIPLKGGHFELLRRGPVFWEHLTDHGVPATLFKLPANFPVKHSAAKMISGMGTPDMLGSYGTFTLFTDVDVPNSDHFTGGRVVRVDLRDHEAETALKGPPNTLREGGPNAVITFHVSRDPWAPVVKINLQQHQLLLREGEWSEWLPVQFEMMPLVSTVNGMVRIYLQQVHPHLRLYFSPINCDPMDANLPISNPTSYAKDLSRAVGRFYTQGFPADTKALSNGVFADEEFLDQAKSVLQEELQAYEHELAQFSEGFFFFYFSSIDQNSHVMLRTMDPTHNLYNPLASTEVKEAVYYFYRAMDNVLKMALAKAGADSSLLVLSDHGFAPFTREFNLSTWLVEKGYTVLQDADEGEKSVFYDAVDWSKTQAYAMGLNGIYINIEGREKNGSTPPRDAQRIKDEIIAKLCREIDPVTNKRPVAAAYDAVKIYSGPFVHLGPDIIVGYESGYRIADEAVLGNFPKGIFRERLDKWSADHCMAPHVVPGILLANEAIIKKDAGLWDLAPTILNKFGIMAPAEMEGKSVFS
jgi:predicted AlkP superfamily phosphohydrolase/phosphomutase